MAPRSVRQARQPMAASRIDLKARAVTETGKVVPGLYVSGEAASQYGQGVSIGVILGKLAADTAAEDIAKMK